jgi:CO/xanthine dehydrogenase Mo-binding subunit/CO/xanthine dehydrogenase FAD-binding subunit
MTYIGQRVRPLDWEARTSGRVRFAGDLAMDGLLIGRVLRSPHPHARILAIDTSRAKALPGVHAVIGAADLPAGARYIHEGAKDRPPFADGVVRFIGQEVAAVAAETEAQANAALAAIAVEYDILPAPLDIATALAPGAKRLHDRPGNEPPNVAWRRSRRWGDPEGARRDSAISASGAFLYPRQSHASMEPNVAVAAWHDGEERIHLWTSTQSPYWVVEEVAQLLGLHEHQVVCHEVGVGGGFGGKSKICEHEVIAAALARAARRPVRLAYTREEEFAATKTRHAFHVGLTLRADREGYIRGVEGTVTVENGAFNHTGVTVTAAGVKALGQLYRPQGIAIEAMLVDTATQPGGSFRGYGSTQTTFALESLVDELAEQLGRDPIELRQQNANHPMEETLVGSRVQSARLVECLDAVRDAIGWRNKKAAPTPGRGVGVAVGMHVSGSYNYVGSNRNDGAVDVFSDGHARVRFGGADTGTGQRTILAQIAADELGIPLDRVEVLSMETGETPYDQGAWGSRGTYYSGHSTRLAAREAAARLRALAAPHLGNEEIRLGDGFARSATRQISIGELVRDCPEAVNGALTTEVSYVEVGVAMADKETGKGNLSGTYAFAAHAAEVEVDRKTGKLRVIDYVAAHDIGTAINPTLVEGQIAGGAAMGLGAALGEELIYEQGKLVNQAYLHYALPRAADLPRIRAILVEGGDPKGPYGAKSVGEVCTTPPAPAVANAVFDAIGVRIRHLPITPDKILTALAQKEGRRRDHAIWRRPDRWWIGFVRWCYPLGLLQILRRHGPHRIKRPSPQPLEAIDMPARLGEALKLLRRDAMLLGGGSDVQHQRRQGLAAPTRLVSTLDIAEMKEIATQPDGSVRVGAAVTLATVAHVLGRRSPIIAETINRIASHQIREMATVGGNLVQAKRCWFFRNGFDCYKRAGAFSPCYAVLGDHRFYHAAIGGHRCQAVTPSDLATLFVALGGDALIAGPTGQRVVAMSAFYTGPGETVLGRDEILVEIRLSATALGRPGAFEKLNLWEGDFANVAIAIVGDIDDRGIWRDGSIVFGALAPVPWRACKTEAAMRGLKATPEILRRLIDRELDAAAHPLKRNGWKLDAAAGLAERAIERLNPQAARAAA